MIELSIIILNYNTKKLLVDCLKSIYKFTKSISFEVIVVDNNSTDGSPQMTEKDFAKIILIKNHQNLGFAKANNLGIKKAKGKYILILNSDTVLKSNALKRLIDFAGTKKDLGIAGPRLLNVDGSFQSSTARFLTLGNLFLWLFTGDRFLYSSPEKIKKVDWISGACFLLKRDTTKKIGLLDEKFFMYIEEMEYCFRAKKTGLETWFFPEAEIYHLTRGSSPEGKKKVILWIYEGILYFYQKHFGGWQVYMVKLLLRIKAAIAWFLGLLLCNQNLKETYGKAFKMVR